MQPLPCNRSHALRNGCSFSSAEHIHDCKLAQGSPLTQAVVMMTRAKRQGANMFHTPLRSSCRDMAMIRVPDTQRTCSRPEESSNQKCPKTPCLRTGQ